MVRMMEMKKKKKTKSHFIHNSDKKLSSVYNVTHFAQNVCNVHFVELQQENKKTKNKMEYPGYGKSLEYSMQCIYQQMKYRNTPIQRNWKRKLRKQSQKRGRKS